MIRPEEDLLSVRLAAAAHKWALALERHYVDEVTAQVELQASRDAVADNFTKLQPSEKDRKETLRILYCRQPFIIKESDFLSSFAREGGSRPTKSPRKEIEAALIRLGSHGLADDVVNNLIQSGYFD
jgi:hypothetical protein